MLAFVAIPVDFMCVITLIVKGRLDTHASLQAASELFRASLELNSTDSYTVMLAGLLERRRKNWDVARELFRRGVALTKENASLFQVRPDL